MLLVSYDALHIALCLSSNIHSLENYVDFVILFLCFNGGYEIHVY